MRLKNTFINKVLGLFYANFLISRDYMKAENDLSQSNLINVYLSARISTDAHQWNKKFGLRKSQRISIGVFLAGLIILAFFAGETANYTFDPSHGVPIIEVIVCAFFIFCLSFLAFGFSCKIKRAKSIPAPLSEMTKPLANDG